jgi:hypothetical protein
MKDTKPQVQEAQRINTHTHTYTHTHIHTHTHTQRERERERERERDLLSSFSYEIKSEKFLKEVRGKQDTLHTEE